MRKFIIVSILLSLAGCQFTVGQAILTSVGSTNTSKVTGGHIVSTNSGITNSPIPSDNSKPIASPSPSTSPKGVTNIWGKLLSSFTQLQLE